MREIGTPKIDSHIKRPRITIKLEDKFSRKKAILRLHICEIADKKNAYNEGRLYINNFRVGELEGSNQILCINKFRVS